jgi:hypothetical protein
MEEVMDDRTLLSRARTVLGNLAAENERPWWNFWTPRWPISHEPLRADAKNLVREIDDYWEAVATRARYLRAGD